MTLKEWKRIWNRKFSRVFLVIKEKKSKKSKILRKSKDEGKDEKHKAFRFLKDFLKK